MYGLQTALRLYITSFILQVLQQLAGSLNKCERIVLGGDECLKSRPDQDKFVYYLNFHPYTLFLSSPVGSQAWEMGRGRNESKRERIYH